MSFPMLFRYRSLDSYCDITKCQMDKNDFPKIKNQPVICCCVSYPHKIRRDLASQRLAVLKIRSKNGVLSGEQKKIGIPGK